MCGWGTLLLALIGTPVTLADDSSNALVAAWSRLALTAARLDLNEAVLDAAVLWQRSVLVTAVLQCLGGVSQRSLTPIIAVHLLIQWPWWQRHSLTYGGM